MFLCCTGPLAYPRGKTETPEEGPPLNAEWVFCITAFDVSALPPAQRIVGDVLVRSLATSLEAVDHRIRVSQEFSYYEDVAWSASRSDAGKKLAAKRTERDLLLFRGNAEWKYRRELKTVDDDIVTLEEELKKAEALEPHITERPAFRFTEGNIAGNFPAPPAAGGEYRFCTAQKADAFLAGVVTEFRGRIYLSLRMYVLYTRAYEYEDSVIFSSEDINGAVEELTGRLVAAVSGTLPAAVSITAQPDNAVILLKESFAGRGETGIIEHPPGPVEVEVFAEDHETVSLPLELYGGELAELYINLEPLSIAAFDVRVPEYSGASVYQGALYLGEAPLTLNVPRDRYEYVHVEAPGGEAASIVFRGVDDGVDLKPVMPYDPEEKRTNRARRRFYGAYGRLWVVLPAAFVLYGMSASQSDAYELNPYKTSEQYDKARRYQYVSIGMIIAAGVLAAEGIYRIFRYVHTSGEDAVSIKR